LEVEISPRQKGCNEQFLAAPDIPNDHARSHLPPGRTQRRQRSSCRAGTPSAIAQASRAATDAGAHSVHVHAFDEAGSETLDGDACAHVLRSIRALCPLTGGIVGYLYVKTPARQKALEIIHQERMAAMEKGIPWPEFPPDPSEQHVRPEAPVLPILGIFLF
jgi:beta-keto acid cleavage enzyme